MFDLTRQQQIAFIFIGAFMIIVIGILLRRKYTYFDRQNVWLDSMFSTRNVMVYGAKGNGKDLLFALVIWLRDSKHYANMPYNKKTEVIELKELNLGSNTFDNLVYGDIEKIDRRFDVGADIYISDAGIYFPSHCDKDLDRLYPSLPIHFALSRQLNENNIHCNMQALDRLWKKLREQGDCYIWCVGKTICDNYIEVETITYSRYKSAIEQLLPSSSLLFKMKNGDIVRRLYRIPYGIIEYDTHYFRNKFIKEA